MPPTPPAPPAWWPQRPHPPAAPAPRSGLPATTGSKHLPAVSFAMSFSSQTRARGRTQLIRSRGQYPPLGCICSPAGCITPVLAHKKTGRCPPGTSPVEGFARALELETQAQLNLTRAVALRVDDAEVARAAQIERRCRKDHRVEDVARIHPEQQPVTFGHRDVLAHAEGEVPVREGPELIERHAPVLAQQRITQAVEHRRRIGEGVQSGGTGGADAA